MFETKPADSSLVIPASGKSSCNEARTNYLNWVLLVIDLLVLCFHLHFTFHNPAGVDWTQLVELLFKFGIRHFPMLYRLFKNRR